jgi:hypothetical protein
LRLPRGRIFSHSVYVYLTYKVMSPEADLRPRPSMHTHSRDREDSSGQATQFNIWTIRAVDRTSAQPQVNLSVFHNNSLKFQPQKCKIPYFYRSVLHRSILPHCSTQPAGVPHSARRGPGLQVRSQKHVVHVNFSFNWEKKNHEQLVVNADCIQILLLKVVLKAKVDYVIVVFFCIKIYGYIGCALCINERTWLLNVVKRG